MKTPSYVTNGTTSFGATFTPSSGSSFLQQAQFPNVPGYGYTGNSASSFSSGSGSVGGTSFSSTDALPAISRNFVRPSDTETRRPATAGAALQSRSPFGGFMTEQPIERGRSATVTVEDSQHPETIDEGPEGLFSNPFGSPLKNDAVSNEIDLQYGSKRPVEQAQAYPSLSITTSWDNGQASSTTPEQPQPQQSPLHQFPLTSAPPNVTQFGFLGGMPPQNQMMHRPQVNYGARPQTSDGIPSYGSLNAGGISLPSARTIVNQIDPSTGFPNNINNTLLPIR